MVFVRPSIRRSSCCGVALQPVVALGPAGVVLALVAAVAGVGPDLGAQPGDLAVVGGRGRARLRCRSGAMCPALVRSAEARSRRDCGERGLNDFGIRIRSSASTGTGKSIDASRLTCRSAVSTSGRGPSWCSKPAVPVGPPGGQPRVEDQREPGELAGRHVDDVARLELLQRRGGLRPAAAPRPAWPAPSRGP